MSIIPETLKSVIFNKLVKSNNSNIELRKNLKLNKIELTTLYK